MLKSLAFLSGSLIVLLLAATAPAATYLSTDFQTSDAGWYLTGPFARTDLGGGNWVLADNTGAAVVADNYPATFPAAIQIDMDLARTANGAQGSGDCFAIFFHLANGGMG